MTRVYVFNWEEPEGVCRDGWAIINLKNSLYLDKTGRHNDKQRPSESLKPEFNFASRRNAIRQAKNFFPSLKDSKIQFVHGRYFLLSDE